MISPDDSHDNWKCGCSVSGNMDLQALLCDSLGTSETDMPLDTIKSYA
jgi:hypothetical protein